MATHPVAVRELAFEVWALAAGRQPGRTVAHLAELLADDQTCPTPPTITTWVERYDWHRRADDLVATIAPNLVAAAADAVLIAGVSSLHRIIDSAEGRLTLDKEQGANSRHLARMIQPVLLSTLATKLERTPPRLPAGTAATTPTALAALTDDELLASRTIDWRGGDGDD